MSERYVFMVTGSREWRDWVVARRHLEAVYALHPEGLLIHGDASRGADRMAGYLWKKLGGEVEACPARWMRDGRFCPYAGFERNAEMVARKPDRVLAFFAPPPAKNKGTEDATKKACAAGIPIVPVGKVPPWLQAVCGIQEVAS